MHTITRSSRELTSRDLAQPIPANRARCILCDGTGDDFGTTGERCGGCHGFGHVSATDAAELDAIFRRTGNAQLLISDRAASS